MKKIILTVVLLVCLVFVCSCSEKGKISIGNSGETKVDDSETKAAEQIVPFTVDETPIIEKQVILDEKGIKITACEIDYAGIFGPELVTVVENTSERNITVQTRNSAINGAMVSSNFTMDIRAGESKENTISFSEEDMELYGITTIEEFEFGILISDSVNWETILSVESVCIKTSAEPTESDLLESYSTLLDNAGVYVCCKKDIATLEQLGAKIHLGVKNTTEKSIKVYTTDVAVDGRAVRASFSSVVAPAKTLVGKLGFSEWELKSLGIDGAEEVSFNIVIMDEETKEIILESGKINISLK